ncbi:MAG: SufD family Fe-S cluster assembly protein [Candidatus Hodgkinia cicadicola]
MLAWRVNSYYCMLFTTGPRWANVDLGDFRACAAAADGGQRVCEPLSSFAAVDKRLVDVDVVCDASSVYLRVSKELKALGVRFASISKAVLVWSPSVRRYMGSVVSHNDNYFSMLNSCLFTDGTYISVPARVRCPTSLSTYFKISSNCTGQFERTLIIVNSNSSAVYFEGCNAAKLDQAVLHAAVVELVIKSGSNLKYTTLQNWYTSDRLGVYNLVTKRALCAGVGAKVVWVQVEVGANVTWKYPSSVLCATNARAEFYSLSVSNNNQQIDTGTKVFHLARHAASIVLAKSVLFGCCSSSFRLLLALSAAGARNHTRCDALVAADSCVSRAVPIISISAWPVTLEYESLSSYVTAGQLRYCKQRGISEASALKLVVTGYSHEVIKHLPLEASLEVAKLLC